MRIFVYKNLLTQFQVMGLMAYGMAILLPVPRASERKRDRAGDE